MAISNILFEYKHDKQSILNRTVALKGVGILEFEVIFSVTNRNVFFIFQNHLSEKDQIIRIVMEAQSEILADIFAWKLNSSLMLKKIKTNVTQSSITTVIEKNFDSFHKEIFGIEKRVDDLESALSAYRQIKNEKSKALRYIMCYRLLEIIARRRRITLWKLLKNEK